MDKFIVKGPTPLKGNIPISGSKNAALPLLAAALLADEPVVLENVPRLQDIYTFNNVLRVVGAQVQFQDSENRVIIDPSNVNYLEAPYDLVRKMRASFYMLGALVGKHGYAKVSMPGGCAWGPLCNPQNHSHYLFEGSYNGQMNFQNSCPNIASLYHFLVQR